MSQATVTKFIRLPIDEIMQQAINPVLLENPFFNELDAIRYLIGKQMSQNQANSRRRAGKKFLEILNQQELVNLTESQKAEIKNQFPELTID